MGLLRISMAVENSSKVIPLPTLPGNLVDWSSLLSPTFSDF
jgi:hypothetical protein